MKMLLKENTTESRSRMSASAHGSVRMHAKNALAASLVLCAANALAAGGLNSASAGLSTFQIWLYSFAGLLALSYLTWKGIEAFTERAHWSDFAVGVGKVAVVGGVLVLGNWAWNLFTS